MQYCKITSEISFFLKGPIEFEEPELSSLQPTVGTPDSDKRDFPVLEKPKKEVASGGKYIHYYHIVSAEKSIYRYFYNVHVLFIFLYNKWNFLQNNAVSCTV